MQLDHFSSFIAVKSTDKRYESIDHVQAIHCSIQYSLKSMELRMAKSWYHTVDCLYISGLIRQKRSALDSEKRIDTFGYIPAARFELSILDYRLEIELHKELPTVRSRKFE